MDQSTVKYTLVSDEYMNLIKADYQEKVKFMKLESLTSSTDYDTIVYDFVKDRVVFIKQIQEILTGSNPLENLEKLKNDRSGNI